jgi:quaternary ammonium compound-resistance protein SugE
MSTGWVYLIVAGLFEIGFTTAMNFTGRGKWLAETAFLVCVVLSFTFLEMATKTIPIGIAYAVWTGIGATGTVLISTVVFKQPITMMQIGFIVLLIGAVVGLKLTGAKA